MLKGVHVIDKMLKGVHVIDEMLKGLHVVDQILLKGRRRASRLLRS
jgi:hypothetical protein